LSRLFKAVSTVFDAWRLRRQSWVTPGLNRLWQERHSSVASLTGGVPSAAASGRGARHREEHATIRNRAVRQGIEGMVAFSFRKRGRVPDVLRDLLGAFLNRGWLA
jgi:hypothetical protein